MTTKTKKEIEMAKFKEVKMFSKDRRFIEEAIYYVKKDSKTIS